jgi:hypothetical protein
MGSVGLRQRGKEKNPKELTLEEGQRHTAGSSIKMAF